jgi:hypothetical protein
VWGKAGPPRWTTVQAWTGRTLDPPSIETVVLRYLAAFGPASTADVRAWSGLAGMREVTEGLRPRLRTFRDEGGRELFDVPDGPLPRDDTPAPVRFLPEFDNTTLSHADRSRVLPGEHHPRVFASRDWRLVLVDGFARALWRTPREGGRIVLEIEPLERIAKADRAAVTEEGARLVAFLTDGSSDADIRFR